MNEEKSGISRPQGSSSTVYYGTNLATPKHWEQGQEGDLILGRLTRWAFDEDVRHSSSFALIEIEIESDSAPAPLDAAE